MTRRPPTSCLCGFLLHVTVTVTGSDAACLCSKSLGRSSKRYSRARLVEGRLGPANRRETCPVMVMLAQV